MTHGKKRPSPHFQSGESNPRAKLTDHEVDLMRTLWNHGKGLTLRVLVIKFEVSKSQASKILRRKQRL